MKAFALLLALATFPVVICAEVNTTTDQKTRAQNCAQIAKADARLACFDQVFQAIDAAKTAGEVKPEAEFGLSQAQLSERDPERATTTQIEASITAIRTDARGKRIVTLDNGQVWAILESPNKGSLKPGDQTSVRKASLGTFMLLSPAGIALRARRVN